MNTQSFRDSVATGDKPPAGLTPALDALWWARKGEWPRAHALVQEEENQGAAWVHAYLHRVEGDLANAGYWYRRAGQPMPSASERLDAEWEAIVAALLPS